MPSCRLSVCIGMEMFPITVFSHCVCSDYIYSHFTGFSVGIQNIDSCLLSLNRERNELQMELG